MDWHLEYSLISCRLPIFFYRRRISFRIQPACCFQKLDTGTCRAILHWPYPTGWFLEIFFHNLGFSWFWVQPQALCRDKLCRPNLIQSCYTYLLLLRNQSPACLKESWPCRDTLYKRCLIAWDDIKWLPDPLWDSMCLLS